MDVTASPEKSLVVYQPAKVFPALVGTGSEESPTPSSNAPRASPSPPFRTYVILYVTGSSSFVGSSGAQPANAAMIPQISNRASNNFFPFALMFFLPYQIKLYLAQQFASIDRVGTEGKSVLLKIPELSESVTIDRSVQIRKR